MYLQKNIKFGKINFFKFFYLFLVFYICIYPTSQSKEDINVGEHIELNILDKVSSKNNNVILKIGEEKKFKNLLIKSLKCTNSEFDDNPEVTAYLQVKDITYEDNNRVFVFNGWAFSSSPSIQPFDHPVYDIWLTKCF